MRIVECKGYNYPIDEEYAKKWLHDNIPTIRKWILDQDEYKEKKLIFELWCTGGFEKDAKSLLDKGLESTKKYDIRYYGRDEILAYFKNSGNKNLENIMSKHFS